MFKYFLTAALLIAPACQAENKDDKPNRSPNIVWETFCNYVLIPVVRPLDLYIVRPCEKYHIPEIVACTCAIAIPFIIYYDYLLHKARSIQPSHE